MLRPETSGIALDDRSVVTDRPLLVARFTTGLRHHLIPLKVNQLALILMLLVLGPSTLGQGQASVVQPILQKTIDLSKVGLTNRSRCPVRRWPCAGSCMRLQTGNSGRRDSFARRPVNPLAPTEVVGKSVRPRLIQAQAYQGSPHAICEFDFPQDMPASIRRRIEEQRECRTVPNRVRDGHGVLRPDRDMVWCEPQAYSARQEQVVEQPNSCDVFTRMADEDRHRIMLWEAMILNGALRTATRHAYLFHGAY